MMADALVPVPDSMQAALGDDWVEAQVVLDHLTVQEEYPYMWYHMYETWRQGDDEFDC